MESIKNRNESYKNIASKLPSKRQQIYMIITNHECISAQQIKAKYMFPINEISGRITELKERCLIEEAGSVSSPHSRHSNTLYRTVKSRSEIISRINMKYAAVTNIKDALVRDYHRGLSPYGADLLRKQIARENEKIKVLEQTLKILN